jgi:GNAT superfamily N-acetyltransferase
MHDLLPPGGLVRKLWPGEAEAYRDHLLRLDPESRRRRFSGAVGDDFIARHASHGVGTVLLEHILLAARNRGITALEMQCLADNRRMQQLARKFAAEFKFDFGSVVGEVDPPRFTVLSLAREWTEDAFGVVNAMLDAQARLVRAG